MGNFETDFPTQKQIASLKGLLNYLLAITPVDEAHVIGHSAMEGQATVCPGRYLPVKDIVKRRFFGAG